MPRAAPPTHTPNPRSRSNAVHRVEVAIRRGLLDPAGSEAAQLLREAGVPQVDDVRVVRTYFLALQAKGRGAGKLAEKDLERAAREVLADAVTDVYVTNGDVPVHLAGHGGRLVQVHVTRRAGVTDPEAESARAALAAIGLPDIAVKTAHTYVVRTKASAAAVLKAAHRALGNDVIEEVGEGRMRDYAFPRSQRRRIRRQPIRIRRLDGEALVQLSLDMGLSLNRPEMETIREHFRALRREPTDVELETLAQTWSEHCKHKTLAGTVHMRDHEGERHYQNVLKETIFDSTQRLAKPWCWSVFEDNAGVIDFDGVDGVCMKVETHNHPSAIEPYGGAGTGIGGVIRDILGTGLGARPIANTDVFCFGPPDLAREDVPKGAMHPVRLLKGVVAGVRDYGNRMGIPTVNGAILFDPRYVGNPVVYCGCVGLIPKEDVEKAAQPGDLVVAFGGRTGRDGIHGATFSSVELHAESETVSSGAVQIGDPITEKKVLDVLVEGRDRGYFRAVTDCGAGGFSSAVGEMGEKVGADVDLAHAPLKYEGLDIWEIWISEAQERMVAAVPPRKWPAFRKLCESEDVEAVVLGHFTGDGRLKVRHGDTLALDLEMSFLHDGLPRLEREAVFTPPTHPEPRRTSKKRYDKDLLDLLGTPQIGSKEWVIRQYDHEVQAGAVVRPLVGPNDGPADAAVIAPKLGSNRGIVLAGGINPGYGDIDPHAMAMVSVDEAIRNAVCVGADPRRMAVLDNFTWGNCNRPELLGAIVRAAEGCRDAALLYSTPFISGKDSLNNEYRTEDGTVITVPSTLLISAIGVISDVRRTVTSALKTPRNPVYVVGATYDECGGGRWYALRDRLGTSVPRVRDTAPTTMRAVAGLIRKGWVRAAHDPSEGGLAVAAAEMAFASDFGLDLNLGRMPGEGLDDARRLFSESASRFLLEIARDDATAAEAALKKAGVPFARLGHVTKKAQVVLHGRDGGRRREVVRVDTDRLRNAWRHALALDGEGN